MYNYANIVFFLKSNNEFKLNKISANMNICANDTCFLIWINIKKLLIKQKKLQVIILQLTTFKKRVILLV